MAQILYDEYIARRAAKVMSRRNRSRNRRRLDCIDNRSTISLNTTCARKKWYQLKLFLLDNFNGKFMLHVAVIHEDLHSRCCSVTHCADALSLELMDYIDKVDEDGVRDAHDPRL